MAQNVDEYGAADSRSMKKKKKNKKKTKRTKRS